MGDHFIQGFIMCKYSGGENWIADFTGCKVQKAYTSLGPSCHNAYTTACHSKYVKCANLETCKKCWKIYQNQMIITLGHQIFGFRTDNMFWVLLMNMHWCTHWVSWHSMRTPKCISWANNNCNLVCALWQEGPKLVYAFWSLQPVNRHLNRSSSWSAILVYKYIILFGRVRNGCSHDFKFTETSDNLKHTESIVFLILPLF